MDFEKFQIKIKDLKISGSEESVSKTIEELLHLNDRIPARWEDESKINSLTNKQFEENDKYMSKEHRGEQRDIYEEQLDQRRKNKTYPVQEAQFEGKESDGVKHRPETWDMDDEEVRGHKNVQPIWHEVYKLEDKKKDSGSLDKKL